MLFTILFIFLQILQTYSFNPNNLLITTTIDGGITARRIKDGEVMWTTSLGGSLLETYFPGNYIIIPSIDKSKSLFSFQKSEGMMKRLPLDIETIHSSAPTLVDKSMVTCQKTYNTFSIDVKDGVKYPLTAEKGFLLLSRNEYHLQGIDMLSGIELWNMKYGEYKVVGNVNKMQQKRKKEMNYWYVLIDPSNMKIQLMDGKHQLIRSIVLDDYAIVNAFIYSFEDDEVYEISHEYMMYSDEVVVNSYRRNLYAIILSSSRFEKEQYPYKNIQKNNEQLLLTYLTNISQNESINKKTTTTIEHVNDYDRIHNNQYMENNDDIEENENSENDEDNYENKNVDDHEYGRINKKDKTTGDLILPLTNYGEENLHITSYPKEKITDFYEYDTEACTKTT